MQPDDDDMDDDVRDLLTGIIVVVKNHKTDLKGYAEVWLSSVDQLQLRALINVTERYASQIGKEYSSNSPIFVNKNLEPWRKQDGTGHRVVDYSRFAKIAGVKVFHSHDTRHVWTDSLSNQTSLVLKEAYALSANHSVATQQKHYVSNFMNTLKKVNCICRFVDL